MSKLFLVLILFCSLAKADDSEMMDKTQEALIKTFKIDEILEKYEKEIQKKYIPDSYIKPAIYLNIANSILIKKQISLEWRF